MISNRAWIKLLDKWSKDIGERTYTISEISRTNKPIIDAWFDGGQSDFTEYSKHRYCYQAMWCYAGVSRNTSDVVGKLFAGRTAFDYGGTIFTAVRMVELEVRKVNIVNLPSRQTEFAKWILTNELNTFGDSIEVIETDQDIIVPADCVAISMETFEHFREPLVEFERIAKSHNEIAWKECFCTNRYGHFIPVVINGVSYVSHQKATKAFVKGIEQIGFDVSEISRNIYYARRKA